MTILKNMGEGKLYKSSIMDSFQIMYNLMGECLVYINGTAITLFLSKLKTELKSPWGNFYFIQKNLSPCLPNSSNKRKKKKTTA